MPSQLLKPTNPNTMTEYSIQQFLNEFSNVCALATFLGSNEGTVLASKLNVSLQRLAEFKYICPDLIDFCYTDTFFDPHFGQAPEPQLTFGFHERGSNRKSIGEMKLVIKKRITTFENQLMKFISKHGSLQVVQTLALKPELNDEKLKPESANDITECINQNGKLYSTHKIPKQEAVYSSKIDLASGRKLWRHQAKALDLLYNENNLIISTPTASGKSLIFQSIVKQQPERTSLFIYPTKALAQDQLRAFTDHTTNSDDAMAFTYDGDVDMESRKEIMESAKILFTNPDILHASMLPNWDKWTDFLSSLAYVIIDEVHVYSGIFGQHVAMILRRLRRVCAMLGNYPQFIGCSATLAHPQQYFTTLTGLPCSAVTNSDDGSPSSAKEVVCCASKQTRTGRLHPISLAAPLMAHLVNSGKKVIAFCKYRNEVEQLLTAVYKFDGMRDQVVGYRGGYTPDERRILERKMFNNEVKGIVATNALELGIDIGSLDAALIVGFPYSVASFRQQIGRVGRRENESLVVYIAGQSVLDEYYLQNPNEMLFAGIAEIPLVISSAIAKVHIQAAASEQPLTPDEFTFFPDFSIESADLENLGGMYTHYKPVFSIRDEQQDVCMVIERNSKASGGKDKGRLLEKIELDRIGFTVYEGGIFIHQGVPYLVVHLDPDLLYAYVQKTRVKWTTRQRDFTDVDPMKTLQTAHVEPLHNVPMKTSQDEQDRGEYKLPIEFGEIKITNTVFGFFKFDEKHKIIGSEDINMPSIIKHQHGIWINLNYEIMNTLELRANHLAASIHAAEHAVLNVLPVFVDTNNDVRTECKAPEKELNGKETNRIRPARLIFYEKVENGVMETAFHHFQDVLKAACSLVDNCDCLWGCARCITYPQCTESNLVVSKTGARVILRLLLKLSLEDVPYGPEPNLPEQRGRTVQCVSIPKVKEEPL